MQLQLEGNLSSIKYLSRLQQSDLKKTGAQASPLSAAGRRAISVHAAHLDMQRREEQLRMNPAAQPRSTLVLPKGVSDESVAAAELWAVGVRYSCEDGENSLQHQDMLETMQRFLQKHGCDWVRSKAEGEAALQLVPRRAWEAQPQLRQHSDEEWEHSQAKRFTFDIQ